MSERDRLRDVMARAQARYTQQRMCQLLHNAMSSAWGAAPVDIYYVSDTALADALEVYMETHPAEDVQ